MAAPSSSADIQPRQVANKSSKKALLDAIRMTLDVQSAAVRLNTQTFNRNRYAATALIADYDELKDRARQIKENAIANLPELLRRLEASVQANGGHFYLAKTAADANQYIRDVLVRHQAKLVVKGKSITSEEIKLNHAIESAGITVAETDLAEFILQVADEQPSHIIAPALHYSRERITALFKRKVHHRSSARHWRRTHKVCPRKIARTIHRSRRRHLRREPDCRRQRLPDAGGE